MTAKEPLKGTRRDVQRAIHRLNLIEYVLLVAAAGLAILGGWFIAWLIRTLLPVPFGLTWIASAVLLLGLPGVAILGQAKQKARLASAPDGGEDEATETSRTKTDG